MSAETSERTSPTAEPSRLTLPIILLAVFVVPMGMSGTAVGLPPIADSLGSDPTLLQWIINGFNVAFAAFTIVWGVLSDRMGYKATFIIGLGLMIAASAVSAGAPGLIALDVARVLAGMAGAAIFTGSSAILSNSYAPKARARNFALFGSTIGLGVALGPTVSGLIVSWVDWRAIFVLYGLFPAVALVFSGALPNVRHFRSAGEKAVDFSLLRNPRFLSMSLVPVAAAIGYVTLMTYLPVALSAVSRMTAGTAGLFMLPMTLPVLAGPLLTSWLTRRFRRVSSMTMIYIALSCMLLGDLGMLLLRPSGALGLLVVPMVLLGFSFGLPIGLVDGEAIGSVPARSSGTAAGVLNFMRLGSEAVVIGAYSAVLAWLVGRSIRDPQAAHDVAAGGPGHAAVYASAFHWVVWCMIVLSSATTLAIALLHRSHHHRTRTTLTSSRLDEVPQVPESVAVSGIESRTTSEPGHVAFDEPPSTF